MASSETSSRKLPRATKSGRKIAATPRDYSSTFDDDFLLRRKRRERKQQQQQEEEVASKAAGGRGGGDDTGARRESRSTPKSPATPPKPRRPAVASAAAAAAAFVSPLRPRPLASSAPSPKTNAPVEQLPAPLADLVFSGLSDDELASLVRRVKLATSSSPSSYGPSSPKLTKDLAQSFESLRIRCGSTCVQQWRQILAARLRQSMQLKFAGRHGNGDDDDDMTESESETKRRDAENREALRHEASLPICARLCVAGDIDSVLALVRAYRDELRDLIAADSANENRSAHTGTYITPSVWELGVEPFLRLDVAAERSALGVPFRVGVDLTAERDASRRGAQEERLRLRVAADFDASNYYIANVWDPRRREWSHDVEARRLGIAPGADYRAHLRARYDTLRGELAAERIVARRAWHAFVTDDVARTARASHGVEFVATPDDTYEWVGPDTAPTWRGFARVIAAVQWATTPAATLYVMPSPQDWEGRHVPSPLPRYLALVRAAFPELPVVVHYTDGADVVTQREPHGEPRGREIAVPRDHIPRLVAAAGVSNVVAQPIRKVWLHDWT